MNDLTRQEWIDLLSELAEVYLDEGYSHNEFLGQRL